MKMIFYNSIVKDTDEDMDIDCDRDMKNADMENNKKNSKRPFCKNKKLMMMSLIVGDCI